MIHEIEDIGRECGRLTARPGPEEAPPVLCAFEVRTSCPVPEFHDRLRSVLDPALRLALSHSFDGEDLPVDTIPDWFAAAGDGRPVPEFTSRGVERYVSAIGGGRWELQEWLYQFDPESEFRGWAWWDLTSSGDREAVIWVDTWGESFFACDELRWLAYVAGGEEVAGPRLAGADGWVAASTR
ncbi:MULTISPECIES: hypothetical protein [unclassified Streptomyces]|uniref:hypothetical protein n=1 Tax=unclassified Streptomyces TaxID=2593676 RepID=UPI0038222206